MLQTGVLTVAMSIFMKIVLHVAMRMGNVKCCAAVSQSDLAAMNTRNMQLRRHTEPSGKFS